MTDKRYYRVKIVEGNNVPLQNMGALFCFPKLKCCSAGNHLQAEIYELPYKVFYIQYLGTALYQRYIINTK